ncbi:MAG: hypothetical protein IT427_11710 [Pirellulales bacterium]|nr:hypothetical protein [Pirellulales bacterium]
MASFFLSGCKKQPEITRYQVPKETLATPTTSLSANTNQPRRTTKPAGQDRMLAAIVPHDDEAWFFKLAGETTAVDQHAAAFGSLVKSVTFPESAGGKPEWKSPEDWQRQPSQGIRYATMLIPRKGDAKPLELSVITLPWNAADERAAILSNVNRWRNQMQLQPLTADQLDSETQREKLAGGEAIFADLKGTYTEGMRPPFANPPGGPEN